MEPTNEEKKFEGDKMSVPMAIVVAGVLIAGAIILSGFKEKPEEDVSLSPLPSIEESDRTLGNKNAKVALIVYEDFQCPFCGAISGLNPASPAVEYLKNSNPGWTAFLPGVINDYVKNGKVLFVYRDFAFLGEESLRSAEAARCAGDQDKFWEYHDYLYANQKEENKGDFSDTNLKLFAKKLGLDQNQFSKCFDENKYKQAVMDQSDEGAKAGVRGTPKGFILKNGKVVSTIDGAEPFSSVKQKIDSALK